ncbi:PAS domain S-box protein [Proteobacteria bacterium 005FR1]|nr:PAS domain S-box protein [Proteobacteria bacterium 005FR1]
MQNPPRPPDPHFRLLFDESPAPCLVLLPDSGFTIVEANKAYLRATNTASEQLIGRKMFEAFPDNPADPAATGTENLRASLERVVRNKAPDTMAIQRYDIRVAKDPGEFEERYWSPVNTPVLSPDGELLYLIHKVEDVTDFVELSRANESARSQTKDLEARNQEIAAELVSRSRELYEANIQLRQSEARMREAITIETVGVIYFDMAGGIHYANEAFMQMCGYRLQELQQISWEILTDPAYLDVTGRTAENLMTRGEAPPYEKRMVRKDGSQWWGLFASKRVSGHGRESQCVEFIIDISERKQAEEALREADQRKDEFLAMLAHELRNPLAAIHNVARLLESRSDVSKTAHLIGILRRQAGNLDGLVADLLDVSRITRGLIELRLEQTNLVRVAEAAAESVQGLMDEKQHELTLTLPSEPVWVIGDPVRLEQVVVNLLTNAAKYTDAGGRITLRLAHTGENAELTVSDTGIGMTAEVRERIFELFSQAERGLARSEGGLGIGLTVARNLVERHGGTIQAHSAGLGQGAQFVVCLPVTLDQDRTRTPLTAEPAARIQSCRILIVEDSEDIAETLALLLEHLGHQIAVAHDGPGALAIVNGFAPDLILMDIGLPGMSGYELARLLREHPRTRGAVMAALTGYGQARDRERSQAAGFDAHLIKPVDIDTLQAFIAEIDLPSS